MAWTCPECKQINDKELRKCSCGYAFYDVLGIKEDATVKSVEQTYKYLTRVWKSQADTHHAGSHSKLDERVRKINDAYSVFKQISAGTDSGKQNGNTRKIAIGIGIALLIIAAGIFFFSNQAPDKQTVLPISPSDQAATPEKSASAPSTEPVISPQPIPQPALERMTGTPDMSGDKTPDWAIESVKKSHVLDRFSTVDILVDKWIKESSDKLKAIGWIAKKVDEKAYLVSYTASDGLTTTGFYFEIDVETGEIRDIAGNAELQKKYGIKGH